MAKNAEEPSISGELPMANHKTLQADILVQEPCSSSYLMRDIGRSYSSAQVGKDDESSRLRLNGVQEEVDPVFEPEGGWEEEKQQQSVTTSTTSSSGNDDSESGPKTQSPSTSSKCIWGHDPSTISSSAEVVPMTVDTCEELWTRLHDVRINGCILEYTGQGRSIYDNGLAQSNTPLTPMNHYYEVTIVHPGENCYIAIGLARKDYPSHKHPGWNRGSIAYHADDGKIFIGSGIGTPFGPKCHLNDVLGCGIVFPSLIPTTPCGDAEGIELEESLDSSSVAMTDSKSPIGEGGIVMDNALEASSESEDDIWWNNRNQVYEDKVQVFFMRNGKLLGMKEIRIPKGGFFPTVGMMSRNEKVMIDMNPLTG